MWRVTLKRVDLIFITQRRPHGDCVLTWVLGSQGGWQFRRGGGEASGVFCLFRGWTGLASYLNLPDSSEH